MAIIGGGNAICWAHFTSRGGWKNAINTSAGVATVLVGAVFLTVQFGGGGTTAYYGWTVGLLALQGALLLLSGGSRVNAAIRSDLTTGIIESHRMMPTTPVHAVIGYLTGPTGQSMALALATFFVGIAVGRLGHVEPLRWITANLILLVFTVFIWTATAATAFTGRGAIAIGIFLMLSIWFSEGAITVLLPGANVMAGPLIGKTIFGMRTDMTWPLIFSMASQLGIGAICIFAAARRYARPDVSTMGVALGLLLIAVWTCISMVGLTYWDEFAPPYANYIDIDVVSQVLGTMVVTMLASLVPIANIARDQSQWEQRRRIDDPDLGSRPLLPMIVVIACGILTLMPLVLQREEGQFARLLGWSTVIVLLFLLQMTYLLRWNYQAVPRGMFVGGFWMAITWIMPLLADLILHTMSQPNVDFEMGTVSSISPMGAMMQLRAAEVRDISTGVAIQVAMTVVILIVFWISRAKQVRGNALLK